MQVWYTLAHCELYLFQQLKLMEKPGMAAGG